MNYFTNTRMNRISGRRISAVLAAGCVLSASLFGTVSLAAEPTDETKLVGICQYVHHPALESASEGFRDALTEAFGDTIEFIEQNAQGDIQTCSLVINDLVSRNVDLILAEATPALQIAAAGTDDIPVLGTAVTDYAAALDLSDYEGLVGGNISGTSDLPPLDQQAEVIHELFPDAEKVGLLYCSAEPNSEYQAEVVTDVLTGLGYTCTSYPFYDTYDLSTVVSTAVSESDVLYIPTDNTCANNTDLINNICLPAGVPVITGDAGICSGCGAASLTIDYYDLGYETGNMAVRILSGEENISDMKIEYVTQFSKVYNPVICEELGINIPDDYTAIES